MTIPFPDNSPQAFGLLTRSEQQLVLDWIARNVRHRKPWDRPYIGSGSHLLGIMCDDTGLYCSPGVLKGAMLTAGYVPREWNRIHWRYADIVVEGW